jgi:hypothetical protein
MATQMENMNVHGQATLQALSVAIPDTIATVIPCAVAAAARIQVLTNPPGFNVKFTTFSFKGLDSPSRIGQI